MPKKKVHPEQLKLASNSTRKPDAVKRPVAKGKKRRLMFPKDPRPEKGWMVAGFDVSMSSMAGAAIAYDAILKKFKGPVFTEVRWSKEDHYFDRLKTAAKSHELVLDLQGQLLLSLKMENIYLAQEEPWPFGIVRGSDSQWLKQQAEVSGAFLGGLVRYGYENVTQVNSIRWRTVVANDLGITTHHSKWKDPNLPKGWAEPFNAAPRDVGKFRSKQWAFDWDAGTGREAGFPELVPDWPDIIESAKLGKIPRPEDSKARSVQPDDRYDALAIGWSHYLELLESGLLDK